MYHDYFYIASKNNILFFLKLFITLEKRDYFDWYQIENNKHIKNFTGQTLTVKFYELKKYKLSTD